MPKRRAETKAISNHEAKKARRHLGPPDTESESDLEAINPESVETDEQTLQNLQDELADVGGEINDLINEQQDGLNNASGSGTKNNAKNDHEMKRKKELQLKIKDARESLKALKKQRADLLALKNPASPNSSSSSDGDTSESDNDSSSDNSSTDFALSNASGPIKINLTGGNMIGSTISKSLKKKIWTNRYVDFLDLLPLEDPNYSNLTMQFQSNQTQPVLQFVKNRRPPITQVQWAAAWDEFISIYLEKYPDHLKPLMTYGKTIRSMMGNKYNWRKYDELFRRRRQFNTNLNKKGKSWTELKIDLYLESMSKPETQQGQQQGAPFQQQPKHRENKVPPGYCYQYHDRFQYCTKDCTYKHFCPECYRMHKSRQNHPIYMCRGQGTPNPRNRNDPKFGSKQNKPNKNNGSANPNKNQ